MLEKKLHEELTRFREINRYGKTMIMEQDVPPADPLATPPPTDSAAPADPAAMGADPMATPPTDPAAGGTPPDMDSTEEIDITDLVNMTKNIKKEIDDNKQDNGAVMQQMDSVFSKLDDLQSKLAQMDMVLSKIDDLGNKVENMKEKTPQEKLEMRSLDSYPFNQNPQQFFSQKQGEMMRSGKNEYVLTKDDIENYSMDTIRKTFNQEESEDEFKF
jgi:hypothetical protein